ncbi:LOW QUALITY PROTEIN: disintegrin and metalloproteinase domain-containing protein 9-like [Lates calcarifer]|uniref:LOW QUALITY PROTEIN: disintegrin and metalloproteinase domain-containing protein 9-like n=1 Tax=Lates calcarifer TaxID=8187 RepID=A0AAJ7QFR0_LATCA|nr:LOW QUALITY PROTEIN: disintegrin and metalloproteinase domain-containing protein 9-like [Lates calcarifer]
MVRKYILFVSFLLCYINGIDNKDIFNGPTSKLSKYSIVNPQVIHRRTRSVNNQSKEKYEEEAISYALSINNTKHLLHLKTNRDFLHENFVQYSHNASGNHSSSYPKQRVHCYYHGEVEGYENSLVALSTCYGLRGVIIFGNETYGIEPLPQSPNNEHVLYLLKDSQPEPATCGVVSEAASEQSYKPFEPGQSLTSLLRRKRNLPETSYVELVLVVDNLRYNFKKRNDTAVQEEMVEMANLLDGFFKSLNIRVVLVGLEVFKDSNPFSVDGSAGEVLVRFVKWRKDTLIPKIKHDIGQLIVGQPGAYGGGVIGMAFVGTVCSVATSGGINVYSNDRLPSVSAVVAHEMGHNLGMNHDDKRCTCDGKSCIMGGAAGGSATFSSCSAEDFEKLILRGGGVCLRNQPLPSDVVGTAECGNGRLDKGEQCDCGKPEVCNNKCCDPATCKFASGASCAQGACCDNCQIRVAGTQCRESFNTCDLPEYCDGQSAFCPRDFYVMDGLPCLNNAAYCYEGRCQTYDYQCKHLFAPDPAKKAADICFQHANTKGNLFGNCGITSRGDYIKCSVADAMCGKVQCTNVDVNHPPDGAHVSIQIVNGSSCVNADFNLGTDVLDPAYVNPGSPCGKGKACLDFKCVNASALLPNLDCDAQTTCNSRGVCNDQGHCHCDNGWAPPNCDTSGRGGSIDSGPAQIDYSLRNGLLIFFLLVVPVLVIVILVLLYIFRRDSLDLCLKRHRKSHNTRNGNANVQSDRNVQSATTQPQSQTPPDRPGNLPADSTPVSGFRYGELDYWNMEQSVAPAQPPAPPRQGPGVPRPIPPKQPDI